MAALTNYSPTKWAKQGEMITVIFANDSDATDTYQIKFHVDDANPDDMRAAISGIDFPY